MRLPASYNKAIGACLIALDPQPGPSVSLCMVRCLCFCLLAVVFDDNSYMGQQHLKSVLHMHFDFKGYGKKVAVSM